MHKYGYWPATRRCATTRKLASLADLGVGIKFSAMLQQTRFHAFNALIRTQYWMSVGLWIGTRYMVVSINVDYLARWALRVVS